MALLTTEEAARLLRDELGWPLLASDVESAAKRGRLRAEKGPGRHDYLIPEEEVFRFIEEHRDGKLTEAQRERAKELEAAMWEGVPRNGMELLFGVRRKRRRGGWRKP
jgi:hypothetical protein